MTGPDKALDTAMDWLMQVRDAPADAVLRGRVEAWAAADPDHARAWDQARRTWRMLGEVPPPAARSRAPRRRHFVPARAAVAAAALAACLLLVFAPSIDLRLKADHATGTAEIRRVALEDGTVVHLGPESALRTRFSAQGRSVTLLAGEAFFEVTRDPARPFTVEAEGLTSTVVGTAFDVRIAERSLSVAVRSGVVAVGHGGSPAARLETGDRITVDRATGDVALDHVAADDLAGWRDGPLFFADATVAEVVEELRRYQPGWIVVADDALAAERVTGLYDPREPDRALRALVRPVGGQVHEITPLLRVLSRP